MMARADASTRKAALKKWRAEEQRKARALFPLDEAALDAFFLQLEALRDEHGCFHDLRHAQAVVEAMGLDEARADALFDWCNATGGYCDCEIAANSYMRFREARVGAR
jgi:hypothetical protein